LLCGGVSATYATADAVFPRIRALPLPLTFRLYSIFAVSIAAAFPAIAAADPIRIEGEDAAAYDRCLALARTNPADGFESASGWHDHGGGLPAQHCVAMSLVGLKQYPEAAQRLEKLAQQMVRESDALRAEVLSQAAEAWSEAGVPENAGTDLTEALKLTPRNADLLVNRAVSYAQRAGFKTAAEAQKEDYKAAVEDLNKALVLGGPRADALAYRASAWRYLGDLKQAQRDAEKSVETEPGLIAGWLELGNVKRLAQDDGGARKAWLKVIELAPDSPAADDARDNLAALDVHIDGAPAPMPTK
jgi:tetratricopeptide (TPR) repeat protein